MPKTTRVGLDNCLDLYEKLKFEGKRLQSDWHHYDFWNFAVTAWHLHNDWLDKDSSSRPRYSTKKKSRTPQSMSLVLNAVRDVANGSKHFHLDSKSEAKRVVNETHQPEVRNFYSYCFDKPVRGITIEKTYITLFEIHSVVMGYFEWVFDDTISVDNFPEEVSKTLEYIFNSRQVS